MATFFGNSKAAEYQGNTLINYNTATNLPKLKNLLLLSIFFLVANTKTSLISLLIMIINGPVNL